MELKSKIKKYYMYRVVVDFFKHDCIDNRKVISKSYLKDGKTGVIFSFGKDFECVKCGKQWRR